MSFWTPWAETLRNEGWTSVWDICSDTDIHMREMAAGGILGSSSIPSKEKSSRICWTSQWIPTQGWCDLVGTGHNPHDPASASHLPSIAPRGLGWPCPDALGPSAGLSCTAAGRLKQQSASGARGKPIPSLLNEALVSQSLPSGGGGRLEPHSEGCQACCQQPSAQMEAGDKEHVLSHPGAAPLPFLPVLEMNKCKRAGPCPGYRLQSYPRNGI